MSRNHITSPMPIDTFIYLHCLNWHLGTLQLFAHRNLAALIHTVNLKNCFCQINAYRSNLHFGCPFLCLVVVVPPLLWHLDAVLGSGRPFHYVSVFSEKGYNVRYE